MQVSKFGRRALVVFAVTLVVALLSVSVASAQTGLARIRIAHFSPDTPAVEVFVNGQPSGIQILTFGETSGWVELPTATYSVAVAPAGAGIGAAAIGPVNLTLRDNSWTTIAAIGSLTRGTLTAATIAEDYRVLAGDESRVTVFHGIEDAPAVDVILPDGTRLVTGLRFGNSATLTVPAGVYDLAVVASGTTAPAVLNLSGTRLAGATYYLVAATNRLASPRVALRAIPLNIVAPLIDKQLPSGTITQIAAGDARFTTLVTALRAANLVDTLNNRSANFTVFAPTNDAFAALPAGVLDAVLADTDLLTRILLYHVVGGKALASDVVSRSSINPLAGGSIRIQVRDGNVFLNDNIRILITNIQATNGVIHVIDGVLIP